MNQYLKRANGIFYCFIVASIALTLAGLFQDQSGLTKKIMAAVFFMAGAFLYALIQLACYIKNESSFEEDAKLSEDKKQAV